MTKLCTSAVRLIALATTALALAACGGVQIKPEPDLPAPLLVPLPAKIGVVLPDDVRNYKHTETRWGVNWEIDLGPGHSSLVRELFDAEFGDIVEFPTLDDAKRAPDLKAIFEPRIEQYSFATARETGGRHYAVTIRYRINLFTPDGIPADSYTLTGYGNALAKGMSSGGPLQAATLAAMRDAAAKFLVQFPEQPAAKLLAKNEAVVPEEKTAAAAGETPADGIDAVPVYEGEATAQSRPGTPTDSEPKPPETEVPGAPPKTNVPESTDSPKPAESAPPGDATQPTNTSPPTDSAEPAGSAQPPTEESKPAGSSQPAGSTQPPTNDQPPPSSPQHSSSLPDAPAA